MVRSDDASTEAHTLILRITRQFHASRELVWQAWTQSKHLAHWFCPKDFTVLSAECDLRVGGAWRSAMQSPEGKRYIHHGIYREIASPQRLVLTHAWEENDEEQEACQTTLESVITVTLSERDSITEMVFEQVGFTSVASRDSHEGGWSEAFDNLTTFVQSGERAAGSLAPTSSSEVVITRVFDAPCELVWQAWTQPQHIAQWWCPPGFTMHIEPYEFHVGGRFRYAMTGPDGKPYPLSGTFHEIEPMRRLVHTLDFDEGFPESPNEPLPQGLVMTILFEPVGQGTRLTSRIRAASEGDRRRHEAMGVIPGWPMQLDGFAAHLIEIDPEAARGQRNATEADVGKGLSVVVDASNEIRLIRAFAAPRERVFEAHTTPAWIKQWCFAPDGFEMLVCEEDPREGGAFRWQWRGPDDIAVTMTGVYREVGPPKRIVRTETVAGCDSHAGEQLATMELVERDGMTVLIWSVVYPSAEARDRALASGMEHGMAASYDRLAQLLAAEPTGGHA